MRKSNIKHCILSAVLLCFTGLASTALLAVELDGFQQRPPKKSLNKPAEHSSATKEHHDDHHDHDGMPKTNKNSKKTKMHKDAPAEKPHEQHHDNDYDQQHDHDGLKKIPKTTPKKAQ